MGNCGFDHIPNHWLITTSINMRAGFGKSLYDPLAEARSAAARIAADPGSVSLDGVARGAPWVPRGEIEEGLLAYHREAMACVPSEEQYPEAAPFVEQVRQYEQELRRLANLDDLGTAAAMSLHRFLLFRGTRLFGLRRPPQAERCRILLHLETDRGPFVIKNVDDPPRNWRPDPTLPAHVPRSECWWNQVEWVADGVGSGLHMDDEPANLFPLPVFAMASEHAHDTPGVAEFFRRYREFYSGGNLLVYDRALRLAAIESCCHRDLDVFPPEDGCWTHVSGMVCRDKASALGRRQTALRQEYLRLYGLPRDGVDGTFWEFCEGGERMLVEGVRKLGARPRVKDIIKLFTTPYPDGLCKAGYRHHPDQPATEYTLTTRAFLFDEWTYLRWQRGEDLSVWPKEPEMCRCG